MKKHIFYYFALALICVLSIILVKELNFSKQEQFLIVVFLGFFYALWGILHHILHHNLRPRIFMEYVVISMLGISVIVFILKGLL